MALWLRALVGLAGSSGRKGPVRHGASAAQRNRSDRLVTASNVGPVNGSCLIVDSCPINGRGSNTSIISKLLAISADETDSFGYAALGAERVSASGCDGTGSAIASDFTDMVLAGSVSSLERYMILYCYMWFL